MRQLKLFWKTWRCTIPWKLRVFDAVIRSKLFYAMETLVLTHSQQKLLDTFFYRALRRILSIPATYIARQWPNARVLARAQMLTRNPRHPNRPAGPIPFSTYYQTRRIKLLGHILRASDDDLAKAAILLPNGNDLAESLPKRVGRPRQTWLAEAQKDAALRTPEGQLIPTQSILEQLRERTLRRKHPFD